MSNVKTIEVNVSDLRSPEAVGQLGQAILSAIAERIQAKRRLIDTLRQATAESPESSTPENESPDSPENESPTPENESSTPENS